MAGSTDRSGRPGTHEQPATALARAVEVAEAALKLQRTRREYREARYSGPTRRSFRLRAVRREKAALIRDANKELAEALDRYAAAKEGAEERAREPIDWAQLGRWFFEGASDKEIHGEINATFVALVRFENNEPIVPSASPYARYLREKLACYERELEARTAERSLDAARRSEGLGGSGAGS